MKEKTITELWFEKAKQNIKTAKENPPPNMDYNFHSETNFDYYIEIYDKKIIIWPRSRNNDTNYEHGYDFKIKNKSIVWDNNTKALFPDDVVSYSEKLVKENS